MDNGWLIILVSIVILFAMGAYIFKEELIKEQQYNPASASDHIQPNQIMVYDKNVIINQSNVHWAEIAPTGSMKPSINEFSNLLEVEPTTEDQIKVGDVISYKSGEDVIVHRVIKKGIDNKGVYFIVRGDTNWIADSEILRFKDIVGLVIGIIY